MINSVTRTLKNISGEKALTSLLLFVIVSIVYIRGGKIFVVGDSYPSSIAAFNLLQNGTIFFDNFRDSYLNGDHAYWFSETDRGNLVSSYPVGVSILTFPIYVIFYLYLNLFEPGFDITSQDFESYRMLFEKTSAALVTSLSVVIFYLASRLKFPIKVSLLSTFIYAFATSSWSTSSAALWQHGSANLVLIAGFYFMLLASKASDEKKLLFRLLLAGICFGFLPAVRPTSAIFSMAFLAYSIYCYRWRALSFLLGFSSYLPALAWNLYNFGNPNGGYDDLFGQVSPYNISLKYFTITALAHLVSPSRGLLTASPVLIFSSLGFLRLIKHSGKGSRDKWLVYTFCVGALAVFIQYSFYVVWAAGHSLGPRFMTDILLPLCYLINYYFHSVNVSISRKSEISSWQRSIRYFIFLPLLIFSIFVQASFANGHRAYTWNAYPVDIGVYQDRAWHLKDNQIQRHFNAILMPLAPEVVTSNENLSGMAGNIKKVQIQKYEGDANLLSLEWLGLAESNEKSSRGVSFSAQELVQVRASIENTGVSDWYGISSALVDGETWVRVRIYEGDALIAEHRISPLGFKTKPGQDDVAVSVFSLPSEPGEFQMVFDFVVRNVAEFPEKGNPLYIVDLTLN